MLRTCFLFISLYWFLFLLTFLIFFTFVVSVHTLTFRRPYHQLVFFRSLSYVYLNNELLATDMKTCFLPVYLTIQKNTCLILSTTWLSFVLFRLPFRAL